MTPELRSHTSHCTVKSTGDIPTTGCHSNNAKQWVVQLALQI